MPKSATSSSISAMASPSMKRSNTGMTRSPSGLPSLARSTNTRNLASAAGPASPSPFSRTNSKLPPASPARVVSSTTAQSKGFKLLHAMQARLRATDDKLEKKVPKRNVSNPMPLLATRRTTSAASAPTQSTMTMTAKAPHARVQALAGDITTPSINEKSSVLSPNGWVMVDDEDTPLAHFSRSNRNEPDSPLDPGYRAASQASQTSQKSTSSRLPARPGIPSPLASINSTANGLNKSTSRLPQRTPSRAGTSQLAQSVRPASRAEEHNQGGHGRPMSPSMIPRPSSSMMQAFVPSNSSSSVASGQASTAASYSRANSQNAHRVLGRGPPPKAFPGHSIKSSISTSTASNSSLRKSARRSSVSAPLSSSLTSSGLPQAMPRTPSRPVSVSVLEGTPPPPVPRIPSVHLRESKRGHEQLDRRKSLLNR
jgi:nuclear distribution protein NudE